MAKKMIAVLLSVVMVLGCCVMTVGAAANVTVGGTAFKATMGAVDTFMTSAGAQKRGVIYDWLATLTSTDAGMDTLIGLVDNHDDRNYQYIKDYIEAYGVSENEKEALKLYLTILKCVPLSVRRTAVQDWHSRKAFAGYDAGAAYGAGAQAVYTDLFAGSAYAADGVTEAVFYQLLYNLRNLFVFTADVDDPQFDYAFHSFTSTEFKNNLNRILLPEFSKVNGVKVVSAEHFMSLFCEIINADPEMTAAKKRDFAATLVTTNSFVYGSKATRLTLSTDDETEQKIGSIEAITVKLDAQKVDASQAGLAPIVVWYVDGVAVQYGGTSLRYTPPETVGTYKIKAVSGGITSNELEVVVKKKDSGSGTIVSGGTTGTDIGGTTPPAPNMYPAIPDPSEIGFITVNNTTKPIPSTKVTFDDVQNHWSQDYVEVLATTGYLRGHSASSYEPDFGVTREEMAVILVRVLGIEGQKAAAPQAFSDHGDIQDFAVDAVYRLVELGIYKGHSEGHFAPQQILTREEISALFSRVLGRAGLTTDKEFHDHHEIAEWFETDVENLVNYGVINGYPDNTFRPQDDVTRAEAAVMLYNTLHRLGILK